MSEEKIRILVADDEKAIRDGCQRVLSSRGYEILLAENGSAAINVLASEIVDILLLDLKMPVMSGEEVLEIVRERYPTMPVIIITGHGTVDTAVECMKKGAYDFITKPFQVDPFLITVRRAADKRRLEGQTKRLREESEKNLYDLRLEKSRLRTIVQCMGNGVMVCNRKMEMVLHNPALMQMMEIQGEMQDPCSIREIVGDGTLCETLQKMLNTPGADEVVIQETAAGKKVLRAISAPLLGPERSVVGAVTVLEDITPFKQLDQMKNDFVHMVAHELRSPLVSIRQLNSVILQGLAGPLGEKQEDFINRGNRKIDGLLTLINDLLDVAKIEAGQYIQRKVPIRIEHMLGEIVALMEPRAREHRVDLSFTFKDMIPIQADPKSLEEIFNNLITNAINYSPDGGKVNVAAAGHGEYVQILVEDTGVGIDPVELPKIFDKFYRVKHPKTRQVTGTGLGLAIVKGAVEAHHGSIDVESAPGKGTTFRILLPAVSEPVNNH
ncbi:MAG: response regulator [Desulfobacteraceae bacterium]|nr:MAG: response regulator [Desulfobacteraceae bacterium]